MFFPGWLQLGYAFRSSSFDNKVLSILEKGSGKKNSACNFFLYLLGPAIEERLHGSIVSPLTKQ